MGSTVSGLGSNLRASRFQVRLKAGRFAVMKKPASNGRPAKRGRSKSNDDVDRLADALRPWVRKPAFISYGTCKIL